MSSRCLDLYALDQQVGTLFDEHPLRFCYSRSWIDSHGRELAPGLPTDCQTHQGESVESFFENLLPEGHLRQLLETQRQTTTLFGLLDAVGGDTASGFSLQPAGQPPEPHHYQKTTWREIADNLAGNRADTVATEIKDARLSLAGAQSKSLLMVRDGTPCLPLGSSPSSHILKPDIRAFEGVWASAFNETFCQRLAAKLDLGAAEATYQPDTRASLILRYDREWDSARGELRRLHQLDFCQLSGVRSGVKYESDGGPDLVACRNLIRKANAPLVDHQRFIRWIFFNLLIGNHDSHAKNLSILFTRDGPRLAPFYDLMSTNLYPGLARRFAFKIGGEDQPGHIGSEQLDACARALDLQPRYFRQQGLNLAAALPEASKALGEEMQAALNPGPEQTLLERLTRHISRQARQMQARWSR
ncbi:serine/threonine-protein kinase HipA [Kushneria avicenniae]|uniref:Serine/threonine-protein kinase HipA n=1 Tax=Kushneria avicenniae TaxID=402385 RepID=A0A1I1KX84_9GAMM|nr:type II toxin-antitoxin system HipA family toxin [Kushneria avicenniae]SFC62753.1 serine/threonine-protein kinase HipA [Kushneria avicenniae]